LTGARVGEYFLPAPGVDVLVGHHDDEVDHGHDDDEVDDRGDERADIPAGDRISGRED
jgi:hypothetical protein